MSPLQQIVENVTFCANNVSACLLHIYSTRAPRETTFRKHCTIIPGNLISHFLSLWKYFCRCRPVLKSHQINLTRWWVKECRWRWWKISRLFVYHVYTGRVSAQTKFRRREARHNTQRCERGRTICRNAACAHAPRDFQEVRQKTQHEQHAFIGVMREICWRCDNMHKLSEFQQRHLPAACILKLSKFTWQKPCFAHLN